jgi:hypothetical protein
VRLARTAWLASALFSVLVVLGGSAPAAAAPSAGLGMSIDASDPIAPTVTLTNHTGGACQVVPSALGTVGITSLSVGGKTVTPVATDPSFPDALDTVLAARLITLAPGASTSFPLSMIAAGPTGHVVETVTWSTLGSFGQVFPVPASGRWDAVATYAVPVPPTPGAVRCPPATTVAAATDAATTGSHLLLIAIGAAVLILVIALIVLLLVRRRRRPSPVAAIALLLLAGIAVVAWPAHAAFAGITVTPGMQGAYDSCLPVFNGPGGDPAGIFKALNASTTTLTIQAATTKGDNHESSLFGQPFIMWDPSDRHAYTGGGNSDPCSALYHEMNHAYEDENGGQDHSPCVTSAGNSGLPTSEVNATRAQNKLRVAMGLPPRKTYGDTPLPSGPCLPKDQQPKPKGTCSGAGCGDTNGDPHLLTFDGGRFDFQAAGEFVAARDAAGGFEIQTRQQPFPGSQTVAVNTAVAMRVTADRIEVDLVNGVMQLLVNGAAAPLGAATLPGGGSVAYDTSGRPMVEIDWPDGSHAYVTAIGPWGLHLTAQPARAHAGKLTGLLGNFDGSAANDKPTVLYPTFADAHRITASTSLFTYAKGTGTATYTDRSFPHRAVAVTQLPTAAAAALCQRLGVTDPVALADCTLDVAETGQASFAEAALDTPSTVDAVTLPTPEPTTSSTLGTTSQEATLTITKPNETAGLDFEGVAGERLYIAVESSTIPDQCGALTLLAPGARTIAVGCIEQNGSRGGVDGTLLPATGTYQLLLTSDRGKTGDVRVRLIGSTDTVGAFTGSDSRVTAVIGTPGQVATYTFQATAGQRVLVMATGITLPQQCGVPILHAPDGTTLSDGCVEADPDAIDGTPLTASGTYTLVVDPAEVGVGQVTLQLVLSEDQHGTLSVGGAPAVATITAPGQVALFTFHGAAGQKVTVRATGSTVKAGCGELGLIAPTGTTIGSGCLAEDGTGSIDTATLPTAGTYTVEVDPSSINTGSVTVTVS